jgi:signal transduction histidine kinase
VDPSVDRALTADERRVLFHIAQEALSNAARHSRATRVDIVLAQGDQEVEFVLQDNGQGFDVDRADRRVGHGLMNMSDRVSAVGGRCVIDSRVGEGAAVRVSLPRRRR